MTRRATLCVAALLAASSVAWAVDPDLRRAAGDPNALVRADAARRLARDGSPAAARILVDLLRDRDPAARDAAVLASGRLSDPKAIGLIAKLARSSDEEERRRAAEALGLTSSPAAVDTLASLAGADRSLAVRVTALDALAAFGADPSARSAVRAALKESDPDLRAAALHATAAQSGEGAAASVLAGFGDDDAGVRAAALDAQRVLDPPSVELRLPEAAADPAWQVRARAVEAALALRSAAAVECLLGLLGDSNLRVKDAAHRALRALSGKDMGADVDLWRSWWGAVKDSWKAPEGDLAITPAALDKNATRATYHGVPVNSDALVFVIDASGSMDTPVAGRTGKDACTRWEAAGAELERTLAALPDGTLVNVLTFQGEVSEAFDAPRALDERVRRALSQFLRRTSPREHGDLVQALESALAQSGADTVYLLTDGDPSAGRAVSPGRVQAAVRQANRRRAIAVHTIGFGAGKMMQRALLAGLARDSGGVCVFRED